MRLMHFTTFVFVSGALFLGGCGLVALGQINDTARKSSIPPETAREMTELKRLLQESPGDPAVLFTLAMDYATIGEKALSQSIGRHSSAHSRRAYKVIACVAIQTSTPPSRLYPCSCLQAARRQFANSAPPESLPRPSSSIPFPENAHG
jgi:hypothetical protein